MPLAALAGRSIWLIALVVLAGAIAGGALGTLGGRGRRERAGEAPPRSSRGRRAQQARIAGQLAVEIADLYRKLAVLAERWHLARMADDTTAERARLLDHHRGALDAYAYARLVALSTMVLLEDEALREQAQDVIATAAIVAATYGLSPPPGGDPAGEEPAAADAEPVDDEMAAALAALTGALSQVAS